MARHSARPFGSLCFVAAQHPQSPCHSQRVSRGCSKMRSIARQVLSICYLAALATATFVMHSRCTTATCGGECTTTFLPIDTCVATTHTTTMLECKASGGDRQQHAPVICAVYGNYVDAQCEQWALNRTNPCGVCETEDGEHFDVLRCPSNQTETTWQGHCTSSCENCQYSGVDRIGECIQTPPGEGFPLSVKLLGFASCPPMVMNTTWDLPATCQGPPRAYMEVPSGECQDGVIVRCVEGEN